MSKTKFLAYGEGRHGVEAVMRMHSVKRWHMIDTTRQQTLAEHSANVALLALLVAKTAIPVSMLGFDASHTIAVAALIHDSSEAFTGDIPTHVKPHISGLDDLEEEITPVVFCQSVTPNTKALIKLCDLADGIRFIRLHGVDMTARHAREGLEEQLSLKFKFCEETLLWPTSLIANIRNIIMFYAYENS